MNTRNSTLSVAAVLAASVLALQAPVVGAQTSDQRGVPGVEMNVGNNASDRGLPGVEANIGREGDQNNVDIGRDGDQNNVDIGRNGDQDNVDTRALGAGADNSGFNSDGSTTLSPRADRG